jgi:hypothetical protein
MNLTNEDIIKILSCEREGKKCMSYKFSNIDFIVITKKQYENETRIKLTKK